ncbi:hypothetical protein LEN26_017230 [Aphanomyces euteiches]|nr:hypothetical protein LEN26_017230 [Aphanomyces euteiches]KAH9128541.1 hypothetical protein AeMF1_001328 [Aphanomyces euteiches]KAH9188729.1 hypothetical protein AeNC1_009293 [Aphanomyces euteiches]
MKLIYLTLALTSSVGFAQDTRQCTQVDISLVQAAWTDEYGEKCLSKYQLTLGKLPTARASVLAKADKDDDCLTALLAQDNIIDEIVHTSGDCKLSETLSLYDTTFHEDNGFVTGWATALKELPCIDVTKVNTSLLLSTERDSLPDCTQNHFNLVDAAWGRDFGNVSADVLATAESNPDCTAVLEHQGDIVNYIVDEIGDCRVVGNTSLYDLSFFNFSEWANVIKTLDDIDIGAPASSLPEFQLSSSAGGLSSDNSTSSGTASNGTTSTTTTTAPSTAVPST